MQLDLPYVGFCGLAQQLVTLPELLQVKADPPNMNFWNGTFHTPPVVPVAQPTAPK